MKKDIKILIQFIVILLMAVVSGVVSGRYVAVNNIDIALVPTGYMEKLVYTAPLFMVIAAISLVIYTARVKKGYTSKGMAEYIAIYVFAVMGVIVSGFCGMYSMASFIPVAAGLVSAVIIILLLAYIQRVEENTGRTIHTKDYAKNNKTLFMFCLYGTAVVLSAFIPLGPAPAVVICALWRYMVKRTNNR